MYIKGLREKESDRCSAIADITISMKYMRTFFLPLRIKQEDGR